MAEAVKNLQWMRQEIERTSGVPCLSDEQLEKSRQETLSTLPDPDELWIFGYGSLMWNPNFTYEEEQKAKLSGYSRAFCLKLFSNRATPEKPGLMLALDEGGECEGVVFRISKTNVESITKELWIREMLGGIYVPKIMPVETMKRTLPALVFTVNRSHSRYAGQLAASEIAAIIAKAEGKLGSNCDYLFQLVTKLKEKSIHDENMLILCEITKKCM
jgi:cation transport protein ChaC